MAYALLSLIIVFCTLLFLVTSAFSIGRSMLLHSSLLSPTTLNEKHRSIEAKEKTSEITFLHITEYPKDNFSHIHGFEQWKSSIFNNLDGNATEQLTANDAPYRMTKLQEISAHVIAEVIRNKKPLDVQGCGIDRSFYISEDDLQDEINDFDINFGPPLDLFEKIKTTSDESSMALAAEFKRASPSKGDINLDLDPVAQCLEYANMGAAVISVLTEFKHFKGSLRDLKNVRTATQKQFGRVTRPLILRKDFIFDRYQILEARAHGADTVLLIVATLGVSQLKDLIKFSRSMGMEPLVEVNTQEEMLIALECGAKVIGINNRSLHTFQLDMSTTARALEILASRQVSTNDVMIAALSGISSAEDVSMFRAQGVRCCLVGEALMKASNPAAKIRELLGASTASGATETANNKPMVKICGITSTEDAEIALREGAGAIGMILAKQSPRRVADVSVIKDIVQVARSYGERNGPIEELPRMMSTLRQDPTFMEGFQWYRSLADLLVSLTTRRPVVIGVFQDQSAEEINSIVSETGIDIVQLHGNESPEIVDAIHAPCIKVLHVDASANNDVSAAAKDVLAAAELWKGKAIAILLDAKLAKSTSGGGLGVAFDWALLPLLGNSLPIFLAGGLNPGNVAVAVKHGITTVDICSGVEIQPGVKDRSKVKQLMAAIRRSQNSH